MSLERYNLSELALETLAAEVGEPMAVNVFTDPDASCPCVSNHNPNVVVLNRHHIVPLSWGGADDESNVQLLCPTGHYSVHHLLRVARQTDTSPAQLPWGVRERFGVNLRALAETGWERWKAMS